MNGREVDSEPHDAPSAEMDETLTAGAESGAQDVLPLAPVRPHLFVVLECDRVVAGGARYDLTDLDEVTIGRGTQRTSTRETDRHYRRMVLRLPDRFLSGAHARLVRQGAEWVLEDAGSTNGSLLNGRRVNRIVVADGDIVELGHTLLTVRVAVPTPESTPPDSSDGVPTTHGLGTLSPLLASTYADLARVACSSVPVVVTGSTGTGKEVVARAIHTLSGRSGPWVAVNCGAISPSLIESQLFGHVRGAFSGAVRDEPGLIRSAHGGTLFLDEIGELLPSAQVTLLRVLQQCEVVPVGRAHPIPVDLRVVSASQLDLSELVRQGRFRDDLRARLEGYAITLPPLRHRREDLGVLAASVLANLTPEPPKLRPVAGRMLMAYDWPLNVRELEQTLKRALALSGGGTLTPRHLPEAIVNSASVLQGSVHDSGPTPVGRGPMEELSEADRELRQRLVLLLEQHHGNVSEVARSAGKARMQVHRWMKRLAIDPDEYRNAG